MPAHTRKFRQSQALPLGPRLVALRVLDRHPDAPGVASFVKAGAVIEAADSHADAREATDLVARSAQEMGLDRFQPFLRDADDHLTQTGGMVALLRDVPVPTQATAKSPLVAVADVRARSAVQAKANYDNRSLSVQQLTTPDGTPIELAQDEELAGPAIAAARNLYRELQATYAEMDAVDAELGFQNLTDVQQRAIIKIDNVIEYHALEKDFTGVANELNGIDTGFDHVTEMEQSVTALKDAISSLQGSLKNPYLDALSKKMLESALKRGLDTLSAMQKTLGNVNF